MEIRYAKKVLVKSSLNIENLLFILFYAARDKKGIFNHTVFIKSSVRNLFKYLV